MTLFLNYGAPDPQTGKNPNWETFGYPGPVSPPPQIEKPLKIHEPEGSEETHRGRRLHRRLGVRRRGDRRRARGARAGCRRARSGRLLQRVRLHAARAARLPADVLARRPHADRGRQRQPGRRARRSAAARRSTGPTACARRPWVREQWAGARARGCGRVGVRPPSRRGAGADQRQRPVQRPERDRSRGCARGRRRSAGASRRSCGTPTATGYSPETAAYLGFGDQSGSKQSADRTWLADAQEHGARFLTFTRATRVLIEGGRAAGVEAVWQTPDGRERAGHGPRPARRRRLRLARVTGAAAALRDRRPRGRPQPAAASVERRRRRLRRPTSRPGGAPRRPACATSSRTPATATAS